MTEPPPRTMQALKSFVVALLMIDAIFHLWSPAFAVLYPSFKCSASFLFSKNDVLTVSICSMERGFTFVIWTLMIVAILFDQLSLLPFMMHDALCCLRMCGASLCLGWTVPCGGGYLHECLYALSTRMVQKYVHASTQQKHNPLGPDSYVQDGTNQTNAPSEMPQVLIQPIEMSTQSQAVCESTNNTPAIEQSSAQNSQESPNSSNIKPV